MIQLSLDFGERSSAPPVAVIDKDEQRRVKSRAKYRRWYAKNREKKLAYDRKRRAANPEKIAATKRKWAAENRESERAGERRRYAANPEKKNASVRKWRAANPEWTKANNNKWAAENPEKRRAYERKYREKNREKINAMGRKWYAGNLEKERARATEKNNVRRDDPEFVAARREFDRAWAKANPGKKRAKEIKYHFNQEQRTPIWADMSEINEVYLACPEGMTVDHIVPLRGKTVEGYRVNGLHVPWNLGYLTRSENSSKGNRMRSEDGITAPLPA